MSSLSVLASLPEDHFRCSICLKVFSDPVTTPCGHNFCKSCLSERWDNSELCHCPTCNKRFHARPEVSTNAVIEEISVQIKRRKVETLESANEPWQVKCDVCTGFKLNAMMSCLVCLTSYCEDHLEPHQRVPSLLRHKLIDPVGNLEERVCERHERILELFCRDEEVCICLLCSEADHKDHETVTVEEEGAQRKENIESTKAKIKLMIEDREKKIKEFTDSSEMSKERAQKEIDDSDKLFNTLMSRVQEMHTNLKSNIEQKLRKSQEKHEAVIQGLHQEITDLQKKHSELEELLQNDDHLQLLQTLLALDTMSDTKDWSRVRVYPDLYVQTLRRAMSHVAHSCRVELKNLTDMELKRMRQYKESVTFDEDTAGSGLLVTESGTRLKFSKAAMSPEDDIFGDRFTSPMVLGTNGFSSGRHYWEVQVGVRNDWDVGVAKETVSRTGVTVKKENGFFAIGKAGFDYRVKSTSYSVLHLCPRPRKIGVYLDYEGGRVSFYDVNEKLHIYSFTGESFTEELFPYFYLYSKAKKSEPLLLRSLEDLISYLSQIRSLKKPKE